MGSLVLGILSIIMFMAPIFGIVSGILAIVFSNKQKKINYTENAKAGKITGIIGIILSGICIAVIICFVVAVIIARTMI